MKRNDIIFLLASTLIMTVAWIVFSIIHAATTSTITNDVNLQILPIPPTFDATTIKQIINRQKVNPLYSIQSQNSSVSAIPSATPTPSIIISQGGSSK